MAKASDIADIGQIGKKVTFTRVTSVRLVSLSLHLSHCSSSLACPSRWALSNASRSEEAKKPSSPLPLAPLSLHSGVNICLYHAHHIAAYPSRISAQLLCNFFSIKPGIINNGVVHVGLILFDVLRYTHAQVDERPQVASMAMGR